MTTTQMTTGLVEANDVQLYHETRGTGPAVLCIPGGSSDAGAFAGVAERLADAFTVVSYDRRGLSRSPRPDGWTQTSIEEQADDCAALIVALGLDRPALVGHSLGGSIAVSVLERHAHLIRGAVLYEPGLSSVTTTIDEFAAEFMRIYADAMASGGFDAAIEAGGRFILGDAAWEQVPTEDRERMKGNAEVNALELTAEGAFTPDAAELAKAGVPVHGLVGADTTFAWLVDGTRWAVEATNGTLHTVPGAHGGMWEDPDGFTAVVRTILEEMS